MTVDAQRRPSLDGRPTGQPVSFRRFRAIGCGAAGARRARPGEQLLLGPGNQVRQLVSNDSGQQDRSYTVESPIVV